MVLPLIAPAVAAAIISGVAALGSGIASAVSNRRAQKKNNQEMYEANKKLSEQAFQQNKESIAEQNNYNSPSAQLTRLRAAGMSPSLLYGQGVAGATGSQQAAAELQYADYQPVAPQYDFKGISDSFVGAIQAGSQSDLNMANAAKARSENVGIGFENVIKAANAGIAQDLAEQSLRQSILKNDQTFQEIQNAEATYQKILADTSLTEINKKSAQVSYEILQQSKQAQIDSYEIKNEREMAETRLIEKKIKSEENNANEILARINKIYMECQYLPGLYSAQTNEANKMANRLVAERSEIIKRIDQLAVKTGIDKMELQNWFWLHAQSNPSGQVFWSDADKRNNPNYRSPNK